jgi:hypothetical protein
MGELRDGRNNHMTLTRTGQFCQLGHKRAAPHRALASKFSKSSASRLRRYWPTGRGVVKDADCKPPGIPRKRIKVGPVLLEDRPICVVMVTVYDVALAVVGVVIVWIDFPYNVFGILVIQRKVWIDARVYENAMLIDMHQR